MVRKDPAACACGLVWLGARPEGSTLYAALPGACAAAKEAGLTVVGVYDPFYARYEAELKALCHRYIHSFTELI